MTPRRTEMPVSSAPKARTSEPGRGSAAGGGAGSGGPSGRNATMLVAGARPARRAGKLRPPAKVIFASSVSRECLLGCDGDVVAPQWSGAHPVTLGDDSRDQGTREPGTLGQFFRQVDQRVLCDVGHDLSSCSRWSEDGRGRDPVPPDGWGGGQ